MSYGLLLMVYSVFSDFNYSTLVGSPWHTQLISSDVISYIWKPTG